jgi:hypothetical protein
MSTPERPTKTADEQAAERYQSSNEDGYLVVRDMAQPKGHRIMSMMDPKDASHVDWIRRGYAAALVERAIPAEQALRLAMEYVKALGVYYQTGNAKQERDAWSALRADPIAAKMLED